MSAARAWHGFECWVIYWNPKDFPGSYVVRHWTDLNPDHCAAICATLDIAREHVPDGCINLHRTFSDDPAIFEVWI